MKIFILGKQENYINYYNALKKCDVIPVFSETVFDATKCDALLLTGGGDIDPILYGQKNTDSYDIDHDKDIAEINLVKHFYNTNKAIIGICKGMQIINIVFGGTIIQDIKNKNIHSRNGEDKEKIHYIKTNGNNFLCDLYGKKFAVNSSHHQAIGKLSSEFDIVATSEDNITEAIKHKNKAIYAFQFHPERMTSDFSQDKTVDGKALFKYFLSSSI